MYVEQKGIVVSQKYLRRAHSIVSRRTFPCWLESYPIGELVVIAITFGYFVNIAETL
jgi:hypothetical protein